MTKVTIKVSEENKERLGEKGRAGMSYDEALGYVLNNLDKSIEISEENKERLRQRGEMGMSYDEVLTQVLDKLEEFEEEHSS